MARIFYYTGTGDIYGVHPGSHEGQPQIQLPQGVVWIDVPGPPDQIPWPNAAGQQGAKVDLQSLSLVAIPIPKDIQEQLERVAARQLPDNVPVTIGLLKRLGYL